MSEELRIAGQSLAREILVQLAQRAERTAASGRKRAVNAPESSLVAYRESRDLEFRDAVHAAFSVAQRSGGITIRWMKHAEGHELDTVGVKDVVTLLEHLGEAPIDQVVAQARDAALLASTRPGAEGPDLDAIGMVADLVEGWGRHRAPYGLEATDLARIREIFVTIGALRAGEHADKDMRTFSAAVHQNTKKVEQHKALVSRIWGDYYDLPDFSLALYLGLEKTPQPYMLGGHIAIDGMSRSAMELGGYIGLPRDTVTGAGLTLVPDGVLIVENWTTYVKAACWAPAGWGVLYCAGFPAPGWVQTTRAVLGRCKPGIPLLHWGDLDLGGFRIYLHLARTLERPLRPYRMMPADYAGVVTDQAQPGAREQTELSRIARLAPLLEESIAEILATGIFRQEQEQIILKGIWSP